MDDTQAHKIISAIADGCDPTTGEKVEGSVLQHGDVIRALHIAVRALEASARSKAGVRRARAPRTPASRGPNRKIANCWKSLMLARLWHSSPRRMTEHPPVFTRGWCGTGACKAQVRSGEVAPPLAAVGSIRDERSET